MAKLIIEQDPAQLMRKLVHTNQSKVTDHLSSLGYQLVHKGYGPKTKEAPIGSDYRNHGETVLTYKKPDSLGDHEVQVSYLGKVGARKFHYRHPTISPTFERDLITDNPDHFINHLNKMHGK